MLSLKRFGLGCAAAAIVSSSIGVRAASSSGGTSNDVNFSSAYCSVTAKSFATSDSKSAFVEAWQEISERVCGNTTSVELDVTTQATDVAYAVAEAFAEVVAQCETQGSADARAQAYAYAQDRAEALGEAIAGVWADVTVCDSCSVVADTFVSVSNLLIADAVAEAWTDIYVYSDAGASAQDLQQVTSDIVVKKVADIIVTLSTALYAEAQGTCSGSIIAEIDVGKLYANCDAFAFTESTSYATDAIAQAGADAAAYACDGDLAEAETTVIAQATAQALVEVFASADVWCATNGENTQACGMAQADVEEVAEAQAEAFAFAWAEASSCNCDVAAGAEARVWGAIWVEASLNAYAETCASGGSGDFASDFKTALEERIIVVTAEAIASAVATGTGDCRVSLDVCSSASSNCVTNNFKCYGTGMDNVLPCCDDDYRCVKRNSRDYRCKHRLWRAPSFWDGEVAFCNNPAA